MGMRRSIITLSVLGLLHGVGFADEPPEAKTETAKPAAVVEVGSAVDKVNYSLGYELGQDLKREELSAVPEVLLKGVEDGISGAKPMVKASERRAALAQIVAKRAQENLERSQEFLAANGAKEGVTTLPSGLQYKELSAGEGKTPAPDSRVTVNYRGTLIDGSVFDSSYERDKPSTLEVRKVIKGWREALQLMKEGAKWEIYVPPELAYGKTGRDKRIPPNSALIFEVELLSVEPAPPPPPRKDRPRIPPAGDGD
jgi:FKBP-type peptidyl-prolyl cis-trans isomerase FklB